MPAMTPRGRSRRRTMNEINMVPFIDVMLVLLIIFMVSAPLITPGVIELPTVGRAARQPDRVIEVVLENDEALRLRVDGRDADPATLETLAARVQAAQAGAANAPVLITAAKSVRYESVVRVMDTLQRAGVQRVGLAVRSAG